MKTIKLSSDRHGVKIQSSNSTRYVGLGHVGTLVETIALREVIEGSHPCAVAGSNLRAPGDWPS